MTQYEVSLAEKFVSQDFFQVECSPVVKAWIDLIGPQAIPYLPEERRAKLSSAYSELREHIARWESQIAQTEKKKKQSSEAGGAKMIIAKF